MSSSLHRPLDTETATMLRIVLRPLLDTARDWQSLSAALALKGYELHFRDGRMLFVESYTGEAISTGAAIGVPLKTLSDRLGRPSLTMSADGRSAVLHT
ncbi:hypothetical protein KO516_23565 [Citreicella sp. C3M06]|uniref:hypothetical protein n=1 Tax=Citreicella sp. C3M06 TaxID=2841564 RepID=UPI001C0A41ED|nr:hypothetical protein [Citreicella sp. C3M06]MBU2963751.1 hypothetical protein [Citreicella sp. C3M06]